MTPEDAALVVRLTSVARSGEDYVLTLSACNAAADRIEALAAEVERLRQEVGEWKLLTESAEFKVGELRVRAAAAEAALVRIQEWIGQTLHTHEDTVPGYKCRRCWIEKECRSALVKLAREAK